jgi:hypothetical protein
VRPILLDEDVPLNRLPLVDRRQVVAVVRARWIGLIDNRLLELASREFEVSITRDRSIRHHPDLRCVALGVGKVEYVDVR